MKYFSFFFLKLEEQRCLIIGGGDVAERKVDLLVKADAQITLIAPEIFQPYFILWKRKKILLCHKESYDKKFLDPEKFKFIIVATNDKKLNMQIAADAKEKRILINVVDQPDLCDFIFSSILERGPITVAVSTGGSSPVLARMLRTKLETMIPGAYGETGENCFR